jgi:hypothetical protein
MEHYRVEKNRNRQESMDGAKPLDSCTTNSLREAKKTMKEYADNGAYYGAVFINRDGECIDECGLGAP